MERIAHCSGGGSRSCCFPHTNGMMSGRPGEGAWLWDERGNRWLDFTSGLAVCNLGHCHPRVTAAVQKQLETLWHASNLFHIPLRRKWPGF